MILTAQSKPFVIQIGLLVETQEDRSVDIWSYLETILSVGSIRNKKLFHLPSVEAEYRSVRKVVGELT